MSFCTKVATINQPLKGFITCDKHFVVFFQGAPGPPGSVGKAGSVGLQVINSLSIALCLQMTIPETTGASNNILPI